MPVDCRGLDPVRDAGVLKEHIWTSLRKLVEIMPCRERNELLRVGWCFTASIEVSEEGRFSRPTATNVPSRSLRETRQCDSRLRFLV